MQKVSLYPHQSKAVKQMHNGCILVGGVGTGKSRTSLAYFLRVVCHGDESTGKVRDPMDLYIITTAKKRDTGDWQREAGRFLITEKRDASIAKIKLTVDSWNNISKYVNVANSFFIFDEQRLVGSGAWVKSFYKIAKKNKWVLLSATPADTWSDYIPVMVANGYYRNKTEFLRIHAVFNRFTNYPKIDRYVNTGRLVAIRNNILVNMTFPKKTKRHMIDIFTDYDEKLYSRASKDRWNVYKDEPLQDAGALCYVLRRIVNSDPTRIKELGKLYQRHHKAIVFYNFDYELDSLIKFAESSKIKYACYNGHVHEDVPNGSAWLYFVQYTAGAEAWECTTTNVIIFYSLNYSYRVMVQSEGRIDRLNTPYLDLYYYFFVSKSSIDASIKKSLKNKKRFNIAAFARVH